MTEKKGAVDSIYIVTFQCRDVDSPGAALINRFGWMGWDAL
jgi:hypothetical protein